MLLADWASIHRRSILFVLLIAALGGIFAGLNLPIALFPNVPFPRVEVDLNAVERPSDVMVVQVTRPAEEAVRSIADVTSVRSRTSRGNAELSVTFTWGTDMDRALGQVEAVVSRIIPDLPQGSSFTARKMNPTVFPVAAYSLFSNTVGPIQLRDIAQFELLPLLSAVPGVASVNVEGGDIPEFRVTARPGLLASYGVTMQDLTTALARENVLKVVGRVEDRHELLLAVAQTHLLSSAAIGNTVIRSSPNGTVRLSDVAQVAISPEPNYTVVTADGRPAVLMNIFQQPGGNTVEIVKGVAAALNSFAPKLPKDVTIRNWYDQSQLILESAASVRDAILIGAGLAALVLFAFLRSFRLTATVLTVVPVVLAITVLVLFIAGMSFNIMTLGGMAAAIGLIIDDAIVMIEQIERRLGAAAEKHESIRLAVSEFFVPLAGSSAATVIIFLPLAFLSGVTGAFFKALSLTMASALVVSFFASWFVIPLVADRLIRVSDAENESGGRYYRRVVAGYRRTYTAARARPYAAVIAVAILVVIGGFAWLNTGSGFMPVMDEGGFILDYVSPPGTSLADTNAMVVQVEQIIRTIPEVETWSSRTGLQLGGGLTEANTGDFFIRLKPPPRRPIEEVMADVQHRVGQNVSGLSIETAQLMEDLIGDLTAVPQPVEIKLFGDDAQRLRATAEKVAGRIGSVPGITEVKNGIVVAGSNLAIDVNPVTAGLEGLAPSDVADQAQTFIAGSVATQVQQPGRTFGVRVWLPHEARATIEDLSNLPISAADGHAVPLSRIASLHISTGEPEITRENLKLVVPVTARIEGRDMGSTVADVKRAVDASGNSVNGTMYYELGGLYQQQQSAFAGLIAVIAAAFLLVFALLLFLYERYDFAIAIILMPLLAMPAVFAGLWLTGTELNITALMGMTMVIGIVTEVAIFYFSEYQVLLGAGVAADQARLQAGVNRFRPIAMTTLAAILALLPLALPLGQGGEMQRPLAIAIISGLIVQMPLVLIIMPLAVERLGRLSR